MKYLSITLIAILCLSSCISVRTQQERTNSDNNKVSHVGSTTIKSLRHVVLFKFKKDVATTEIRSVEEAFAELAQDMTLVTGFEWGLNNSPENLNKDFTHCFILTFNSEADRDAYLPHADHQKFVEMLKPLIDDVIVVDYWVK